MKNKTSFLSHSVAFSALFVLGDAVIILPLKGADEYTFLGFLAASVIGFLLYLLFLPLSSALFSNTIHTDPLFKKAFYIIFYILISLVSLFCAAKTFSNFIKFANSVILPEIPLFVITASFILAVIFFFLKGEKSILKFSLIAFAFILIAIIFFTFSTFKDFNFRNIFIFSFPKPKKLYQSSLSYIKNPLCQSFFIPIFLNFHFGKKQNLKAIGGFLCGICVLGVCLLTSLLLFGADFSGKLPFAYSSAISTVTVGRLFTRMDGFAYYIFFSCALVKISLYAFILKGSLKRINLLFSTLKS